MKTITIGIDASNLRQGGGRTHLIELLRAADPTIHGIDRVIVWASKSTLNLIDDRDWLVKTSSAALNRNLFIRALWQIFCLSKAANNTHCDVIFVPGGSFVGNFRPTVTMCQNLLPFEWYELCRYRFSLAFFKFLLLRFTQHHSLHRSDGVIFLSNYSQLVVEDVTKIPHDKSVVIPHGLNKRFCSFPRAQYPISHYGSRKPFRILYVSTLDQYKHQWHVVEAVARLRLRTGWPINLTLVGPATSSALRRLNASLSMHDPQRQWVNYTGPTPYNDMDTVYLNADLSIWASSCETFGIILLESMAAGLPIACSNRGVMPEVLGDSGQYFDPENPSNIAEVLHYMILNPDVRTKIAASGLQRAKSYSWARCANETFSFLAKTAIRYERSKF